VSNIFLFMNSASRQTLESERQDLRVFLSNTHIRGHKLHHQRENKCAT